jgi:hypothetical protein
MHPTMRRNYGQWAYHDRPRPGVLRHTSKHNEEVWTVRCGTQRQMQPTYNLIGLGINLSPSSVL